MDNKEYGRGSKINIDEFYDKYIGYREQSTNETDFYNKMKKYGLWD